MVRPALRESFSDPREAIALTPNIVDTTRVSK